MAFTWSNFRDSAAWSRLDLFLISPILLSWLPNLRQRGLPRSVSDHNPIVLDIPKKDWGPTSFRFFNCWLDNKNKMEDMKSGWKSCFKRGSGQEDYRLSLIIKELNVTFIALIPKIKSQVSMGDFRPISLVRAMYKIIAKILANWLKRVMNSVIGESQMAFLKGRQITDSFVIADEIIGKWKKVRQCGLVIKLDFEKACDSVDHWFLDFMLEEIGFGTKWRRWISDCISSPFFSVLFNGSPTDQFAMERGLRQGDPLSPFLFNIVYEGLCCVLQKATDLAMMKGEDFNGSGIHISHLQFVDDMILFIQPKLEFILNIKRFEVLQWNLNDLGHSSAFIKAIARLFRENSTLATILNAGMRVLIGNGVKANFWRDIKIDSMALKDSFPHVFALANKKEYVISDFGLWEGSS
ncbi:hypothetical protein Dsin_019228 [Dipteronia sinensis]|uniref:Reverse transcriptase domain-containing protein n=1 Tax=Dipteronia sinensis TaxID=43782 RepID=A0AAE0E2B4_9ROSI|nr:hypothetical protein Dsin_019228 [Dipteronia sinensis]